ncbi:MAG: hypothetical protein JST38_18200 [Bacteroidetes bacterium]|nr:hypothetical protein [Bacteroidota bacterium]MBS1942802.1 hypothetical protein [Bacteroidota bacterium]
MLVSMVFSLIASCGVLMAQSAGTLYLKIDPANFMYQLDHKFTLQKGEVELLEGPHHFSFWAPQRKVVDTTLTIPSGTSAFTLRLPYSTEYLVYQRDMERYRKDMRVMRLVPAVVTSGALVYTAFKYANMKKAHDRLDDDRAAYDDASSPHGITVLKTQTMPAHKEEFDKARNGFMVAAGITALFAGTTAYLYWRSGQRAKPEFIDKEKLRFDGLSWMPGPDGGTWQGGLTWNLTR